MSTTFLQGSLHEFRRLRSLAENAVNQVPEAAWFAPLDEESNSIAIVMKHIAGNLRSRWTDFLTSDGEKPDRHRDVEFEAEAGDTPQALLASWEEGWGRLTGTLEGLRPEDLERIVTIRGERHTVTQAILRSLSHTANHVGQIVLLARHQAGGRWKTLSVPRRGSENFNQAMKEGRGTPYRDTSGEER